MDPIEEFLRLFNFRESGGVGSGGGGGMSTSARPPLRQEDWSESGDAGGIRSTDNRMIEDRRPGGEAHRFTPPRPVVLPAPARSVNDAARRLRNRDMVFFRRYLAQRMNPRLPQ